MINLRTATIEDLELLKYWDTKQHVIDSDPDTDWNWEIEPQLSLTYNKISWRRLVVCVYSSLGMLPIFLVFSGCLKSIIIPRKGREAEECPVRKLLLFNILIFAFFAKNLVHFA